MVHPLKSIDFTINETQITAKEIRLRPYSFCVPLESLAELIFA